MEEKYVKENIIINDKRISFFIDYDNKDIYMSQSELTILYNKPRNTIIRYIKNIKINSNFNQVCYKSGHTETIIQTLENDGKYYNIKHYNLTVIKEIGYKLNPNLLNELLNKLEDIFNNNSNNEIIDNSLNKAINYGIVKYQDGDFSLDVNVSPNEDTVWLNINDIAYLFDRDRTVITKHIKAIYNDFELDYSSTCAKFAQVQLEGNRRINREVDYYNLDMIISIGYRVNSKRGIAFRKWASNILKNYLLKGYAYDEKRCLECNSSIVSLENKIRELETRINILDETLFINKDIAFYKGDLIGPYKLLKKIFFMAKEKIIILDPYADDLLLSMVNDMKVDITIYTTIKNRINLIMKNIKIKIVENFHSRAIIVDNNTFLLSYSFNAIGNDDIIISKLENITLDELLKDNK